MQQTAIIGLGGLLATRVVSTSAQCVLNVTVWQGYQVTLPCLVSGDHTDVEWYWCNETCGPAERELVFVKLGDNTTTIGHPWQAELLPNDSLRISSASSGRDNGRFVCEKELRESSICLTVLEVILKGPCPVGTDKTVTYICRIVGLNPAPVLRWYMGQSTKPVTSQILRTDGRSDLTLTVKKEMNGKSLRCETSVHEDVISEEKILDVRYKPAVKVEERPAQYSLGAELHLVCTVDGNPPPKLTWTFKGTVIADNNNHTLSNNNISCLHNFKIMRNESFPHDVHTSVPIHQQNTNNREKIDSNTNTIGEYKSVYSSSQRHKASFQLVHKIPKLNVRHFGVYKCMAENSEGASMELLSVINVDQSRPDQERLGLSTLLPLVITGGVVIIAVVVVVAVATKCHCSTQDDISYIHPMFVTRATTEYCRHPVPVRVAGFNSFKKRVCVSNPEMIDRHTEDCPRLDDVIYDRPGATEHDGDPYEMPFPLAPKRHTF